MIQRETIEQFINAVENLPHDTIIEKFYEDNATISENQNPPKIGKQFLIENERKVLAKAKEVSSKCIRPYFIDNDKVVIRWHFKFVWKDNSITEIEEIAYQIWHNNKISKEQFFYDPKQFVPKKDDNLTK